MTKQDFQKLAENHILLLDGATGSNLMKAGMPRGVCTESWVIEHKNVIQALQKGYIEAGSNIIYAPTFGGNRISLSLHGLEDQIEEINHTLAGYSKEMAEFLTANSGLKSRFPNIIEFPDYTGEELLAIAKLQAGGKGYTLDERCDANLLAYFNAVQLTRARDAGNGRLARNKVEEAILNQSRRLVAQPEGDLCLLLPEDFQLDDVGGV